MPQAETKSTKNKYFKPNIKQRNEHNFFYICTTFMIKHLFFVCFSSFCISNLGFKL